MVESVKAASEIYAPGRAARWSRATRPLVDEPALVNQGAEGDGWFFKLRLARCRRRARRPDGPRRLRRLPRDPRLSHGPASARARIERRDPRRLRRPPYRPRATPRSRPCWHAVGAASLDELIDRAVPGGDPHRAAARAAAGRAPRPRRWPPCAPWPQRNRVATSLIGMGYYGTHTPAGDPAQRAGEPGLVHGLHALPGRGQPGPPRGRCSTSSRWWPTSPAWSSPTPRCSTRPPPPPRPWPWRTASAAASRDRFFVDTRLPPADAGRAAHPRAAISASSW